MATHLTAAAALDLKRASDLARNGDGVLRAFQIVIGARGKPRLDFGCMAPSSVEASIRHADLVEPGERMEVIALAADRFIVSAAKQELQVAMLRAALR